MAQVNEDFRATPLLPIWSISCYEDFGATPLSDMVIVKITD
ncbi:MAG: hypothetical protein OEY51_10305 [Cyclobacteriaceae bacterium]|nr:hypothetical protein [Cyclobacteriaceae bacterium]